MQQGTGGRDATRCSVHNLWSQSFSQSYGSNLPTSLIYIVPWTRGCEPRRPDADMGTAHTAHRRPDFHGRPQGRRHWQASALAADARFSSQTDSAGTRAVRKKRKLVLRPVPRSPGALRRRRACVRAGILPSFPFGTACSARLTELTCSLGPTDPGTSNVRLEPFPTSVFTVST